MTRTTTSTRAARLPRSGIRAVADAARSTPGAIRLDIGDPDFPTPDHVADAVRAAAAAGHTHYGPAAGLPSLRSAIAERLSLERGCVCAPDEVVVSVGAAGVIFCTLLALLDDGDEVLLPDPGWSNLVGMCAAAGVSPRHYALDRSRGFEPNLDSVSAAVGPRTRAIVVNTPANPTGAVWPGESLAALAALAAERGLWLIADECYDAFAYDRPHVPAAVVSPDPDSVVTVRSFSKTYAMTGWRVGFVVAAPAAAGQVARAQEAILSCPATPVQLGAEAALTGPQDAVVAMRGAYRRRRDLALAALDGAGISYVRPRGAFYVMVDVSTSGERSTDVAAGLLRLHGVAVVPGDAFGPSGEGFVRVSLAAPDVAIETGMERLARMLGRDRTAA
jgi:aspartate/methionine/tyrosine aminotransferase